MTMMISIECIYVICKYVVFVILDYPNIIVSLLFCSVNFRKPKMIEHHSIPPLSSG